MYRRKTFWCASRWRRYRNETYLLHVCCLSSFSTYLYEWALYHVCFLRIEYSQVNHMFSAPKCTTKLKFYGPQMNQNTFQRAKSFQENPAMWLHWTHKEQIANARQKPKRTHVSAYAKFCFGFCLFHVDSAFEFTQNTIGASILMHRIHHHPSPVFLFFFSIENFWTFTFQHRFNSFSLFFNSHFAVLVIVCHHLSFASIGRCLACLSETNMLSISYWNLLFSRHSRTHFGWAKFTTNYIAKIPVRRKRVGSN